MRVLPALNLTLGRAEAGRHSIWLPEQQIKLPFQFHGRIRKYTCPDETSYTLETLPGEVAILRALAELGMAPPVGDWVYFPHVTSDFGRGLRFDPMGAWGYEMADANKLPPGRFSLEAMQALPITGSVGAWNDVRKPGNVINGYLVDVRRSGHDMLRWSGAVEPLPPAPVDPELEARVRRDCQYPPGQRPEPYQDFFLDWRWVPGARRVHGRALALGFAPQPGESVVDIGCQSGGFLQWSWLDQAVQSSCGPGVHLGIDFDLNYIQAARDLARAAGMGIDYRVLDAITQAELIRGWTRQVCGGPPDHLLLLSMEKHLGGPALWALVDGVRARHTYVETNAYPAGSTAKAAVEQAVAQRGGRYLGDSYDRNPRRLYRLDRVE